MNIANEVKVVCFYGETCYTSSYCDQICNAELIRNCCVNLGLDPDMETGNVLNIDVYRIVATKEGISKQVLWNYKPSERIRANADKCTSEILIRLVLK